MKIFFIRGTQTEFRRMGTCSVLVGANTESTENTEGRLYGDDFSLNTKQRSADEVNCKSTAEGKVKANFTNKGDSPSVKSVGDNIFQRELK